MSREWLAWVDESVHFGAAGAGFYVLAAAVGHPDSVEPTRSALRCLVPRPRRRLHWHGEDDDTRRRLVGLIATLDLIHVVVVHELGDARKQERARRQCLGRLLFELDQLEAGRILIESRGAALDRRDRTMAAAWRSTSALSVDLRVEFARPLDEPMLWLPDAVAGVVREARRTGEDTMLERLGPGVAIIG